MTTLHEQQVISHFAALEEVKGNKTAVYQVWKEEGGLNWLLASFFEEGDALFYKVNTPGYKEGKVYITVIEVNDFRNAATRLHNEITIRNMLMAIQL